MPPKSQKKKIKKLTEAVKQCQINVPSEIKPTDIVLSDVLDLNLMSRWPKPKMKVPTIFLHKTLQHVVDFSQHVKKLLLLGINFYYPSMEKNYTKIFCQSFDDHKAMIKYFDKNRLPYHTFGHPCKRKIKVVIRGLPTNTDLDKVKQDLKSVGIPIIRVHKMHMNEYAKDRGILVLAVVPYDEEGKKLLRVKSIYGSEVTLEPPKVKPRQCHRCQKWGHSQRYCHGDVKCVKCAGDHFSKKCTKDPDEPVTCSNCGGNHTASYRECFYCPDSAEYKKNLRPNPNRPGHRELLTLENFEPIYKRMKNLSKNNEDAF